MAVRQIHLVASYWGLILMGIHTGTHLSFISKRVNVKKLFIRYMIICLDMAVCLYGVYAFLKQQIWKYMFLVSSFVFLNYDENVVIVITDYLAVIMLFANIGFLITQFFKTKNGVE